jgi:deazaflavin-dependent oxidoreductase (nitroreductase family)
MTDLHPPRTREEMDLTLFGDSHVRAYRETNGEQGYIWNDAPTLLLTTKGRSSGQPRTLPLIFVADGEALAIVASKGGAPEHPGWYLNLQANPDAVVQVKGDVIPVTARTASPEERPACGRSCSSNGRTTTSTRPRPSATSRSSSSRRAEPPVSRRWAPLTSAPERWQSGQMHPP